MRAPSDYPGKRDDLRNLAAEALAGSSAAFETLHSRLAGGLRQFFMKCTGGRGDLSDELCQRCWVELWRSVRENRYDPSRSAPSTYLYAIGWKVWLQHCRSRPSARIPTAETDFAARHLGVEPDGTAELSELLQAARDCLAAASGPYALNPDERAMTEGVLQGRSQRELAAEFGIAPSTANARKAAAFDKIRKCLMSKGFTDW